MYNITLLGGNFYSLTGTLQSNTVSYANAQTQNGPLFIWPQIFAGSGTNGTTKPVRLILVQRMTSTGKILMLSSSLFR